MLFAGVAVNPRSPGAKYLILYCTLLMNVAGVMAVDDAGDHILQGAPAAEAAASMVLVMMTCMGTDRKRGLDNQVRLF